MGNTKTKWVQVVNPKEIVGARLVKEGFHGSVAFFDCDTLDRIALSEVKQTGVIETPYSIDKKGNGKLLEGRRCTNSYTIKRDEAGNVYVRIF